MFDRRSENQPTRQLASPSRLTMRQRLVPSNLLHLVNGQIDQALLLFRLDVKVVSVEVSAKRYLAARG